VRRADGSVYREWELDTGDGPIRASSFVNTPPPIISDLLSKATAEHDSHNYDRATEYLRQAYSEIAQTGFDYGISTFLRLPLYLQKAGRGTEAWGEFNRLLLHRYPCHGDDAAMVPMDHSRVYDKMRLFLQREGECDLAVVYGLLSHVTFAQSMSRQGRRSEARSRVSHEEIRDCAEKLLKKANRCKLLDGVVSLIRLQTKRLSNLDVEAIKRELCGLLHVADSYPQQPAGVSEE
jgi:hypothetical protein